MARGLYTSPCKAISGLLTSACLLASGCVHNTVDPSGDGRLFLLLDMPPRVAGKTIRVRLEIENIDPIEIVICSSPQTNSAQLCRTVTDPRDWADVQDKPVDLVGDVIAGGSEVRFFVQDNQFDRNQAQFNLDGNTTIRLFVSNPELGGERHIEIERTVQQSLF